MIKKPFSFLLVIILFSTTAFSKKPSYTITGNILGSTGGLIYLTHIKNGKFVNIDSTNQVDGKFVFTGSVAEPDLYCFRFEENPRARFVFILENEKIQAEVDLNKYTRKISGAPSQDALNEYSELTSPLNKEKTELEKSLKEAKEKKNKEEVDKIAKQIEQNEEAAYNITLDIIKKNKKSFVAAYLVATQRYNLHDADKIDNLINHLDKSLVEHSFVVGMKEKADALRNTRMGSVAPDFTMDDTAGNSVKLSSLFGKGYLLVDFWASWCVPCRAENPNLVKAYNEYHDKGFEVLGVSYDSSKDPWVKAIEKDNLPWLQVSDLKGWGSITAGLYNITGIPANVLLDKEGKIIAKNLKGEALHKKLAELME